MAGMEVADQERGVRVVRSNGVWMNFTWRAEVKRRNSDVAARPVRMLLRWLRRKIMRVVQRR